MTTYTRLMLSTLAIILIVTVASVSAQNKKMATPQERAEKSVTYWNKHLKLSAEQQEKFKTILADEFTQQDAIRSKYKDSKERSAAFMKLREETHSKMETILTPEQHKKFVAMRTSSRKYTKPEKTKKDDGAMNKKPTKPASGSNQH